MEKILLDTDPGTDIDDSYCIAYLLKRPDCRLMGITTVTGEPMERARIADAICKVAGADIPIVCGSGTPLTKNTLQTTAKQKAQLKNWPHRESFPYGAAEFMNKVICENPGEITLLAIGPLTNIAILFTQYPQSARLIKKLVLMGGAFFEAARQLRPLGEWNMRCDGRAAQLVFEAPVPALYAVSLDTTMKVTMKQSEVIEKFTSPILKVVEDFSKIFFEEREESCFHDPLAAVAIFDDDVIRFERGHARIEPGADNTAISYFEKCECGNHYVSTEVDARRFFDRFFAVTRN